MTTDDEDRLLRDIADRARYKKLSWLPALCQGVRPVPETEVAAPTHRPDGRPLPAPHVITLIVEGRVYEYEPPQGALAQIMAYYRVSAPAELVGRAMWLLTKRDWPYKIIGARELEGP